MSVSCPELPVSLPGQANYRRPSARRNALNWGMLNRSAIRARVVPLATRANDDLSDCTTAAERLGLVADLTREMWAFSKREVPAYTRSELPVVLVRARNRGE